MRRASMSLADDRFASRMPTSDLTLPFFSALFASSLCVSA